MIASRLLIAAMTIVVVGHTGATAHGQSTHSQSTGANRSLSPAHSTNERSHTVRGSGRPHTHSTAAKSTAATNRVVPANFRSAVSPASWIKTHARFPAYPPQRRTGYRRVAHRRGGYCCGAVAEPLGGAVRSAMELQVINGQKSRLVLYEYDFRNGPNEDSTSLSLAGRRKLMRLLPLLEITGFPLLIERSDEYPEISDERRNHVVNVLETELWFADADAQVIVQAAPVPGIRGVEAVEIDRNQLNTTRSQGTSFPTTNSSGTRSRNNRN